MVAESKCTELDTELFTHLSSRCNPGQRRQINAQISPEYLCNRNLSDKYSGLYSILIPVKTHCTSACGTP